MKKNKKMLIGVTVLMVLLLSLFACYLINLDYTKSIAKFNRNNSYKFSKIVKTFDLEEHKKVVIWTCADENIVNLSVINKNIFGYSVIGQVNGININNPSKFQWTKIDDSNVHGIYFGVINSPHIKEIKLNNESVEIINYINSYIWFKTGDFHSDSIPKIIY